MYQFTFQCCSALYVCQIRRHIHTRISEHMGDLPFTGKERSIPTSLVYWLTNTCTNTQSPLLISKSYHQALLSGIFLSVKAEFLNLTLSLLIILDLPLLSYFSYVILALTILTKHLTLIFTKSFN